MQPQNFHRLQWKKSAERLKKLSITTLGIRRTLRFQLSVRIEDESPFVALKSLNSVVAAVHQIPQIRRRVVFIKWTFNLSHSKRQ
jgi:hypothetical protein